PPGRTPRRDEPRLPSRSPDRERPDRLCRPPTRPADPARGHRALAADRRSLRAAGPAPRGRRAAAGTRGERAPRPGDRPRTGPAVASRGTAVRTHQTVTPPRRAVRRGRATRRTAHDQRRVAGAGVV